MSDRSFVRFGGLAAILAAITSWAAAAAYYTIAQRGEDLVGRDMFQLLVALAAFWILVAVVAVHWSVRSHGEAWSFFATLVGVVAAAAAIVAALYPIAFVRNVLRQPIDVAQPLPTPVPPTDPLGVATFGFAALWLLVACLLLRRTPASRRLVALGLLTAAILAAGFVASLGAQGSLAELATIAGGAVTGPLYALWLGVTLRRLAGGTT